MSGCRAATLGAMHAPARLHLYVVWCRPAGEKNRVRPRAWIAAEPAFHGTPAVLGQRRCASRPVSVYRRFSFSTGMPVWLAVLKNSS